MPRVSEVLVLCEDANHFRVVDKMFTCFGRRFGSPRNVSSNKSGSKKQAVQDQFPVEVEAFLKRKQRKRCALIVVMDCDELSVEAARALLLEKLEKATREAWHREACKLLLLPKWSIETWIAFSQAGQAVDETRSYKPAHRNHDVKGCKALAGRLYDISRPNAVGPENLPPSLLEGLRALRDFDSNCD